MDVNDPRHGTVNGYTNLDCRCDKCTKAWASYNSRYQRARRRALNERGLTQRGTEPVRAPVKAER